MSNLVKTLRTVPFALLALVLSVALVGTSCSAVNPPVLSVNGWELSESDFLDQLKSIADVAVSQGQADQVYADGNTEAAYQTTFTAGFLNQQLQFRLAIDEVADRGLELTTADTDQAQQILEQNFTNPDELDAGYRESLVQGLASQSALVRDILANATTDEGLRQLYDSNPEQYADQACVSHILITAGDGNGAATEEQYAEALAQIQDIQAQLAGGADFAELATQFSEDPGSASNGGDLDCAPRGTYVTEFDDAVWSQPLGEVGEPVRTDFGYHLILVRQRGDLSFEDVKDQLAQQVEGNSNALITQSLSEIAAGAEVTVDGRYGQFDAANGQVVPPEGPLPDPTATTSTSLDVQSLLEGAGG